MKMKHYPGTCHMAKRILILSHQLLICVYNFSVHVIKDDLVNCIVSYAAVDAT